jgi:hypothetical protein
MQNETKIQKMDLWRYAKQFAMEDFAIFKRPQAIMENRENFRKELLKLSKKELVALLKTVGKQRKINNTYVSSINAMVDSLGMDNQYAKNLSSNYQYLQVFFQEYLSLTTDYKFDVKMNIQQVLIYFKEKNYPHDILNTIAKKTEVSLNERLLQIEGNSTVGDVLEFLGDDILVEMRDQLKMVMMELQ